jgi:hypothetical protein
MNVMSPISPLALAMPGVDVAPDLALVSRIYLGASIPSGGWVGQDSFQEFVDAEVVKRFPNGFTLVGATGFWGDWENGGTIKESSRILEFAHGFKDLVAIREIAEAYKVRFDQQAVMVSTSVATVSFV